MGANALEIVNTVVGRMNAWGLFPPETVSIFLDDTKMPALYYSH